MGSRKEPATQAHDGQHNADNERSKARTDGKLSMKQRQWALEMLEEKGQELNKHLIDIFLYPDAWIKRETRGCKYCGVLEPRHVIAEDSCYRKKLSKCTTECRAPGRWPATSPKLRFQSNNTLSAAIPVGTRVINERTYRSCGIPRTTRLGKTKKTTGARKLWKCT